LKIVALIIILSISIGVPAHVSKVAGAKLFCSNDLITYTFDMHRERVWETKKGDNRGTELEKVKVKSRHCFNCFDVTAAIQGFSLYHFVIRGRDSISPTLMSGDIQILDGKGILKLGISPMICSTKN
jgi:hypothetical protein